MNVCLSISIYVNIYISVRQTDLFDIRLMIINKFGQILYSHNINMICLLLHN